MASQRHKTKTCECGRGKIMTDHGREFNAKNAAGRKVCAECIIDEIRNKHSG